MKQSVVFLAGTLVAASSSGAFAEQPSAPPASSPPNSAPSTPVSPSAGASAAKQTNEVQLTRLDVYFIQKASASGLSEVEAGKLALEQSSNARVKVFAQKIIDDHMAANDQLKSIATGKGQGVAASPDDATDGDDQAIALKSLKGAAFDRRYAANEVKDHEEAVKLFQEEQQSGKDPDLKSFAAQTLPILQQHLASAKELSAEVGGTASRRNKPVMNSGSSSP